MCNKSVVLQIFCGSTKANKIQITSELAPSFYKRALPAAILALTENKFNSTPIHNVNSAIFRFSKKKKSDTGISKTISFQLRVVSVYCKLE